MHIDCYFFYSYDFSKSKWILKTVIYVVLIDIVLVDSSQRYYFDHSLATFVSNQHYFPHLFTLAEL